MYECLMYNVYTDFIDACIREMYFKGTTVCKVACVSTRDLRMAPTPFPIDTYR